MSFVENCTLSITGALYIAEVETDFNPELFYGVILGVHVFGLIMKLVYYQFQHPWMELSEARDCIKRLTYAILAVLVFSIIGGVLHYATEISNSKKFSEIVFIVFGLSLILVSILAQFYTMYT